VACDFPPKPVYPSFRTSDRSHNSLHVDVLLGADFIAFASFSPLAFFHPYFTLLNFVFISNNPTDHTMTVFSALPSHASPAKPRAYLPAIPDAYYPYKQCMLISQRFPPSTLFICTMVRSSVFAWFTHCHTVIRYDINFLCTVWITLTTSAFSFHNAFRQLHCSYAPWSGRQCLPRSVIVISCSIPTAFCCYTWDSQSVDTVLRYDSNFLCSRWCDD
jgi:hypothetical protein